MGLDALATRAYSRLARLFPEEFRLEFGDGLDGAVDELIRDAARRHGLAGLVRLAPRLFVDLVARVIAEHARDAARDCRYGVRMLLASPGSSGAAILCLALGIGLTAAMYGQIRSTVFRPVPGVGAPESLVRLQRPVSFAYFEGLRDSGVFESSAAYLGPVPLVLAGDGTSRQRVWGQIVSPEYFEVAGARPFIGRVFAAAERTPAGGQALVLSHRLWHRRFGADPRVVGRSLRVNGALVTVVGIAAPDFLGAAPTVSAADLWLPSSAPRELAPELASLDKALVPAWDVIGRLAAGVDRERAEATLDAAVRALEVTHADPARHSREPRVRLLAGGRMLPMRDEDLPRAIGFPLVLVSLVLLMACASVATMVLARNVGRRREIAIRLSLGAGPGRLVRQFVTEGLIITALGTAAAIPVAYALLSYSRAVTPLLPGYGHFETRLDWNAVLICGLIAAAFTVVFGLAPARRAARTDMSAALKPHSASATGRRGRLTLRNALVFQQVAISVLLLLITAFVVVGWNRSASADIGYRPEGLWVVRVDPVRDGKDPATVRTLVDRLAASLRGSPGIEAVATAQSLPPAMSVRDAMHATKVDFATGAGAFAAVRVDRVGAGFFAALGVPMLGGREFTRDEENDLARVLVVNRVLARQLAGDADVVGRTLEIAGAAWTIVGVAGDVRSAFPMAQTPPSAFRPSTPAGYADPGRDGIAVLVRGAPGVAVGELARSALAAIEPGVTVFDVTRMTDELAHTRFLARFATTAYGGMGLFGLILAIVGLAGVTAHAVAERRHEIGIRVALGAARPQVLWLVLRDSVSLIVLGTLTGLAAAVGFSVLLAAGVDAFAETTATSLTDLRLLMGGPLLLAACALVACYLPARESLRVEPTQALRAE